MRVNNIQYWDDVQTSIFLTLLMRIENIAIIYLEKLYFESVPFNNCLHR